MKGNSYSIKDLENLTSIKAHTIRIWEQRYNLLQPQRSETNIRFYNDDDVKKILNINMLYSSGMKISNIARLTPAEMKEKFTALINENLGANQSRVDDLIKSTLEMNSFQIHQQLNEDFEKNGMQNTFEETIIPLLTRLGELWQLNTISVGHEHFFSNCFREFILAKTNKFQPSTNGKTVLLFLHQNEEHELSLLMYHYFLRERGWGCVYLGQNVPTKDVEQTWHQLKPDWAITSFINYGGEKTFNDALNEVLQIIPINKLIISGANTLKFKEQLPKSVRTIHSSEDFNRLFA